MRALQLPSIAALFFLSSHCRAQQSEQDSLGSVSLARLDSVWGQHKKLPDGFGRQALLALAHYPELRNTRIVFRVKRARLTAKTRPTIISCILPRGLRKYVITISNQTDSILWPIMMRSLPARAQIGLLGHEIGHVCDFSSKSMQKGLGDLLGHLSSRYMDRLEFHTDWIAIQHGLGPYLKAWSTCVRERMHRKNWQGSDYVYRKDNGVERYMNPDTIDHFMSQLGDAR